MFIGLTMEGSDTLSDTQAFLQETGIDFVNGYGAGETLTALGVQAIPTEIVFGRDGKAIWNSFMRGTLEGAISQALREGS